MKKLPLLTAFLARLYLVTKRYRARYLNDGLLGLAKLLRGDEALDFINATTKKRSLKTDHSRKKTPPRSIYENINPLPLAVHHHDISPCR